MDECWLCLLCTSVVLEHRNSVSKCFITCSHKITLPPQCWGDAMSIYDLTFSAPSKTPTVVSSIQRSFLSSYGFSLSVSRLWAEPCAADMNEWLVNVRHRAAEFEKVITAPSFSICGFHWSPSLNFCGSMMSCILKTLSLLSFCQTGTDLFRSELSLGWVQLVILKS